MEDEYIKGSRDNWDKIAIKYAELEAKRLAMLEEQIEALRVENRNLKGHHLEHSMPPLPSSYVPVPSCCFLCPDESTEETDNET